MKYTFSCIIGLIGTALCAQTNPATPLPLRLSDAMQLAVKHSELVKKTQIDRQIVDVKIQEQRSMGLPQVSAGVSFDVFPLLPTQLIPGEVLGNPGNVYVPVQFGRPWQLTGTLQAEQMLYNEAGRRLRPAADMAREMADIQTQRTSDDVCTQVAQVFLQYQQTRQLQRALDANADKLANLHRIAELQLNAGYLTPTDLKRITVARTNLATQREQLRLGLQSLQATLEMLCGLPEGQGIPALDTLTNIAADSTHWLTADMDVTPLEVQLVARQYNLNALQIKASEAARWPTLSAYANGWLQNQRGDPNFFDPSKRWYGMLSVGLRSQVSLFDGHRQKRKRQIYLLENQKLMSDGALIASAKILELKQAKAQLRSSLYTLDAQAANVTLALEVRDKLALLYREGTIPLTDLLNAQTALAEAESSYWQQAYAYKIAALKIARITGRLYEVE
jgi:outer membrane protein